MVPTHLLHSSQQTQQIPQKEGNIQCPSPFFTTACDLVPYIFSNWVVLSPQWGSWYLSPQTHLGQATTSTPFFTTNPSSHCERKVRCSFLPHFFTTVCDLIYLSNCIVTSPPWGSWYSSPQAHLDIATTSPHFFTQTKAAIVKGWYHSISFSLFPLQFPI